MAKPPPKKVDTTAPAPLTNKAFAGLGGLRDALPSAPAASPSPDAAPASSPAKKAPEGPARAVVRYERKGHGGKEVTRVEGLGLSKDTLAVWLKALKQSLGCGGVVEGDALQLQGDQRERLPALLSGRGVRKVVVS